MFFSPLLLLLSIIVGIVTSSSLSTYQSLQQQYYELLASYEDDDINSPPGPINGWPHTQPYTTTHNELISYNKLLEQRMYVTYQQEYFAIYNNGSGGNKDEDMLHISQVGRPEGSTTGYYTGVTHFYHVKNKKLITFLFSAGRHDGGTNTYFTIDISEKKNPFSGVQELYIDEKDVSTWTWVSSYTVINNEEKVYHYALFSGGSGGGKVGPSKLYIFQEDSNGQLILPPTVEWIEDTSTVNGAARFCLMVDLDNIYDTNKKGDIELVSNKGMPDIIISGTGGLYIYSKQQQGEEEWKLVRSISIHDDLNDDTSAFVGLEYMQDERHLVIAARTRWSNRGQEFSAPTLIYDYQNDKIVQEVSSNGQTVSVALVDNKSRLLVSAGGQSGYTGQPNLMFDVRYSDIEEVGNEVVNDNNTTDQPWRGRFLKQIEQHQRRNRADSMIEWIEEGSESIITYFQTKESEKKGIEGLQSSYSKATIELSDTQLVRDMPVDYTTFDYIDPVPVSSEDYFVIPSPGKTRTRQVLPFQLTNNSNGTAVDLILEINSAQTCNIYYRTMANETATKIMPLPGSEGRNNQDEYYYTRAGDVLVIGDQLYIILAQYNGNNTVYSFSTSVF